MSENHSPRIFKTGSALITESPEMRALSVEDVRQLLKHAYPELAHATARACNHAFACAIASASRSREMKYCERTCVRAVGRERR